ncbi:MULTISPECIES: hypothetical protein [Brevundimonas]|uniref:hypothetical protein n=1 Tax=Brevundimonas sp. C43 TaxID=3068314 RepID=UPI00273E4972|nr:MULTISPECIES: hypothetical protein [Brevundimonas]
MEEEFVCRDGRVVSILIDEDAYEAVATDQGGERIGALAFSLMEDPSGYSLKLVHAFLDGMGGSYRRQGIGREMLRRMIEMTGMAIFAAENDGQVQEDGSHLTGDAPAFVAKMRREGLIVAHDI